MNTKIAIGLDIGGSHISSGAVDLHTSNIVLGSLHSNSVNNKASKEDIFKDWSRAINKTITSANLSERIKIVFAMPGPFHYKTGLAMFTGNDKYESLYNISLPATFPEYLNGGHSCELRFLNDATAFGVGVAAREFKGHAKVLSLTLGTGFGSAFIKNGIPQVYASDVPKGGCLWDEPFLDGIGDDYFSTRWFIKKYEERTSTRLAGVKEIAQTNDTAAKEIFEEFSLNLTTFLNPFLEKFKPRAIVLGGNISKAHQFFLPHVKTELVKAGFNITIRISRLMEEAAIIGSAKLFEPEFWDQVKEDLPNL